MVQTTGFCKEERKPRQGAADIARCHSIAPLGLTAFSVQNRWLAPPANFRDASGIGRSNAARPVFQQAARGGCSPDSFAGIQSSSWVITDSPAIESRMTRLRQGFGVASESRTSPQRVRPKADLKRGS